jgi:DNA invertase Pin-like site-specific DNA recombinase
MQSNQVKIINPVITFEQNESGNFVPTKKRVCAYCRVSTDNIKQKTSYDAQVDEYTKRIICIPTWQIVRICADEGFSGTSTKIRKEFNAMIEAARNGEIDLILTKSITRFTKNTVDRLNYIRELRTLGVEIYFDKENIYSSDTKVAYTD